MTRSNDLRRLTQISNSLQGEVERKLAKAIDRSAMSVATLGTLKFLLMSKDEEVAVADHLVTWLAQECSSIFKLTSNEAAGAGHRQKRLSAAVQDLLSISSVIEWRVVDDEAVKYMAQMKLYAKVTKDPK